APAAPPSGPVRSPAPVAGTQTPQSGPPSATPLREPRVMRPAPLPSDLQRKAPGAAPAAEAAPAGPSARPTSPASSSAPPADTARARVPAPAPAAAPPTSAPSPLSDADEERAVPVSRIRQRIAERLGRAPQTAAILTTFNEIDMSAVTALRARLREEFEQRHGVRLGLMSFFARAAVLALEETPELNAEIRGSDIVYRSRVHMGV